MVLDVQGRNVEITETTGEVVWTADSDVKRPDYDVYRFAYDAYTAVVGPAHVQEDVRLEARCIPPIVTRAHAARSNDQEPRGGFEITTWVCVPIRRLNPSPL